MTVAVGVSSVDLKIGLTMVECGVAHPATCLQLGVGVEPFFTPAALLQDRGDSVKFLDTSKATPKQKADIDASRAVEDEILITRSGTIGRVIYIRGN